MARVVKSDEPFPERSRASQDRNDLIRDTMAKVLRIVFLLFAVALALGAFLVAAHDNVSQNNSLVKLILHVADAIDGPFSRNNGIFTFTGKNGATKDAVVNWGIAALVYLAIGRYLQRLLAPKAR
ncbi:MAG TPA: hypothetical protein VHZ06_10460 [Marmoricola sp.]|jgi:hypothetical protein|nr:hypothetical protein [Marmoricola sp.]